MQKMLAAIMLLLLALPVGAQELESDDPNDVIIPTPAGNQNAPADQSGAVDLLALDIEELPGTIRIGVTVSNAEDMTLSATTTYIEVYFSHNDREFRARAAYADFGGRGGQYSALAFRDDANGNWNTFTGIETTIEENTIFFNIERNDLVDANGAPPSPGRILEDFVVFATRQTQLTFGPLAQAPNLQMLDRMPDSGVSSKVVEMTFGVQQSGNARLASEQPMRASNGEGTTYVYAITGGFNGNGSAQFELEATHVPTGWKVVLPVVELTIDEGDEATIPVIVTTPFAHDHGGSDTFIVTMTDKANQDNVGRIELGVLYLEIPQPAAHHNTVWFHSRTGNENFIDPVTPPAEAYMNADMEDDLDENLPVDAGRAGGSGAIGFLGGYQWTLRLDPGLEMGLDGIPGGNGTIDFDIQAPFLQATDIVSAQLVLLGPPQNNGPGQGGFGRNTTELASVQQPLGKDLTNDQTNIQMTFSFNDEADLIPYTPGQDLELRLRILSDRPLPPTGQDEPKLLEGSMTLPLLEYHDPVDDIFSQEMSPQLHVVEGAVSRNPGGVATFTIHATNPSEAGDFVITLGGIGGDTAILGQSPATKIGAGEVLEFQVSVQVPVDALHGDQWSTVVDVSRVDNPAARGIAQLVVDVTTDEDIESDDPVNSRTGDKESPLGFLAFTALLIAFALRRK